MLSVIGVLPDAQATHFRYGHISWTPGTGNTINFTLQNAWRRNGYTTCVDTTTLTFVACTGSGGFPAVGDVIRETIGGTTFDPGDGSPPKGSTLGPLLYLVTSIDPGNNWLFGLALDPSSLPGPPVDTAVEHTYPSSGNFTAFIESCCRISGFLAPNAHINNPDGFYRTETTVNVTSGNRSPSSALPPIVVCPLNSLCSFLVPGADADSDILTFRLATAAEAGIGSFVQPGPPDAPNLAAIDSSGLYTWDTNGATLGPAGSNTLYSTQVMIEDLDGSSVPKSEVPIDFLIQLVDAPPPPPSFDDPSAGDPSCGETVTAVPGQLVSFTVGASHPDSARTVTLNVAGLPAGATMTPPLPTSGNPVSSMFSWTPTAGQVGTHAVTFEARDDRGLQTLCSINHDVIAALLVKIDLKPGSNPNCTNPNSGGLVPVAIFGTDTFDVAGIDQSSIYFGGAAAKRCAFEDALMEGPTGEFTTDGILDLVCHFTARDVNWPPSGSDCGEVELEGELLDGTPIIGSDTACLPGEATCDAGDPLPLP